MNCNELRSHLYNYFEKQVAQETREALEAHAITCEPCGKLLRTAGEVTCEELVEFLHEYVDGTLAPERKAIFERHMELCPPCIDFLESYKRTVELTGDACAPCDDEAPAIPEALVRAILEARARGE
jgi:hypothetical protein